MHKEAAPQREREKERDRERERERERERTRAPPLGFIFSWEQERMARDSLARFHLVEDKSAR